MKFTAITLFPELFHEFLKWGVVGRAFKNKQIDFSHVNIRDFGVTSRKNVDERMIGGGDGMVLRPDVLHETITHVRQDSEVFVVAVTPSGKPLTQSLVKDLSQKKHLAFVCGRYAGFDERTLEIDIDLEVSIGDFILSGGELAALSIMDAVTRILPDVLGNPKSSDHDSFSDGLLEEALYTKPIEWKEREVPPVLLSGDHEKIDKARRQSQLDRTFHRRPDLILKNWKHLTKSEKEYCIQLFDSP